MAPRNTSQSTPSTSSVTTSKEVEGCISKIREVLANKGAVRTKALLSKRVDYPLPVVEDALAILRKLPDGIKYRRSSPVGYILKQSSALVPPAKPLPPKSGTSGKVKALDSKNDTLWKETTSGTLPEESFKVVGEKEPTESGVTQVLDQIKQQFLHSCPRCASEMKKTFIILGQNKRILVNQCRVCKFYLPA